MITLLRFCGPLINIRFDHYSSYNPFFQLDTWNIAGPIFRFGIYEDSAGFAISCIDLKKLSECPLVAQDFNIRPDNKDKQNYFKTKYLWTSPS